MSDKQRTVDDALKCISNNLFHVQMIAESMRVLGMEAGTDLLVSLDSISEAVDEIKDLDRKFVRNLYKQQQEATGNMINAALAVSKLASDDKEASA